MSREREKPSGWHNEYHYDELPSSSSRKRRWDNDNNDDYDRQHHSNDHYDSNYDQYHSKSRRDQYHSRSHHDDFHHSSRHNNKSSYSSFISTATPRRNLTNPTKTILIRGSLDNQNQLRLLQLLQPFGVLDLRVICDYKTGLILGKTRNFGFLQFNNLENAEAFVKHNKFEYLFEGENYTLEYQSDTQHGSNDFQDDSDSRNSNAYGSIPQTRGGDWLCGHCSFHNFSRRTACLQCSRIKDETAQSVLSSPTSYSSSTNHSSSSCVPLSKSNLTGLQQASVSSSPPSKQCVLTIHALPSSIALDVIQYAVIAFAPVKNLCLVNEEHRETTSHSLCICFAEFFSADDATAIYKYCKQDNGLTIEDKKFCVNRVDDKYLSLYISAIATEKIEMNSNPIGAPTLAQSGASNIVFDPSSGYFYDSNTGFYYSQQTQLYFHPGNGCWHRFDPSTSMYIPLDAKGEVMLGVNPISAAASLDLSNKVIPQQQQKGDKEITQVTTTQEKKKQEASAVCTTVETPSITEDKNNKKSRASAKAFALKTFNSTKEQLLKLKKQQKPISEDKRTDLHQKVVSLPTSTNILSPSASEEEKEVIACLLCKRAFKSTEQLERHKSLSELHKKNVQIQQYKEIYQKQQQQFLPPPSASTTSRDTQRSQKPLPLTPEFNKGAAMMKSMGWEDGTSLGKQRNKKVNNQDDKLSFSSSSGAGIGGKNSSFYRGVPGSSYQEAAREQARQRFSEIQRTPVNNNIEFEESTNNNKKTNKNTQNYLNEMRKYQDTHLDESSDTRSSMHRPLLK